MFKLSRVLINTSCTFPSASNSDIDNKSLFSVLGELNVVIGSAQCILMGSIFCTFQLHFLFQIAFAYFLNFSVGWLVYTCYNRTNL